MILLDTQGFLGIIVAVAIFGVTIAVCLYLYARKNRPSSRRDEGLDE